MTSYEEVAPVIFDNVTVWVDSDVEKFFYRWVWEKIAPTLDTDDPTMACVEAAIVAYVYAELCWLVCDQNFYEDLWDQMDEFSDEVDALGLGFLCGQEGGADAECPESCTDAFQTLFRSNYARVLKAMKSINEMDLLTAFNASCRKPVHIVVDDDGDEIEEDLVTDYASFCRYVSDADYRDDEINGMSLDEYAPAYEWWGNGAEMLEVRTASDEW